MVGRGRWACEELSAGRSISESQEWCALLTLAGELTPGEGKEYPEAGRKDCSERPLRALHSFPPVPLIHYRIQTIVGEEGGECLWARRGMRYWRPRASPRARAPGLPRPRAECRRARRPAPPLSWQRAGAPRCQAAAAELPAAQAHCKQLRAPPPPRPGWEPHPNTLSPSLQLPAEAWGGGGKGGGAEGEAFVAEPGEGGPPRHPQATGARERAF